MNPDVTSPSKLELRLFGPPQISLDGLLAPKLPSVKAQALLYYLGMTGRVQSRPVLATLLWGEHGEAAARNNLRQAILQLREQLADYLLLEGERIEFRSVQLYWVDAIEFSATLSAARSAEPGRIQQALMLYRGDFLEGFHVRAAPEFETWMYSERARLRELMLQGVDMFAQHAASQGDLPQATAWTRRLLELEPWREEAHRQLMRLLDLSGQRSAALTQYALCRQALADELDVEPAPETVLLFEQIKTGRPSDQKSSNYAETLAPSAEGPAFRIAKRARTSLPHNLPPQTTSFVGRAEEMLEIHRLLCNEPDCRLLTLSGPGGIGKTRLALAAAQSLLDTPVTAESTPPFADGLFFVPLVSITAAELVVSAIAEAISLSFSDAADRKVQLLNYLRPRGLLLVLDNFEQLGDAADLLSEMLAAAPATKLLVTSRERLNVQEEWAVGVNALAFPQSGAAPQGNVRETLETYGAIQLFVQRARRVQPSFQLNQAEGAHVARICQLVGGMPLGLELAATWLRALSCREIAQEIVQSLDFLATSLRNVPERHRSLRAVFEQSWQMLSEQERAIFRQSVVFVGGFTREAAQSVAGATLPQLAALVDKSMLRYSQVAAGQGRYEIHELLRQFGAEKLQQMAGEQSDVQDRHADFYTAWLCGLEKGIVSGRQFEVLDAIAADIANVRAGWLWAAQQGKVAAINRSLLTFQIFCRLRGYAQEGATLCAWTLEQLQAGGYVPDPAALAPLSLYENQTASLICVRGWLSALVGQVELAKELLSAGIVQLRRFGDVARQHLAHCLMFGGTTLYYDCQYARANDYLHESRTLFTALADNWGIACTLLILGRVAEAQSEFNQAQALLQESVQRFDKDGEQGYRAYAANALGRIATVLGNYAQAEQLVNQALAVRREMRDRTGIALSLSALGYLLQAMGRWEEAAACHQEGVDLHLENGNTLRAAFSRNSLADALFGAGHVAQARQLSTESLAIFQQLENAIGVAYCLHTLGKVARQSQDFVTAQRLYRESLALHRTVGTQHQVALSLCELGQAALSADDRQIAQDCLHEALAIATDLQIPPLILEIVVGWAAFLRHQDDGVPAVELLTLAEQHPASTSTTKDNARRLRATVELTLPVQLIQAAKGRVAVWQLQQYALELLAPSPDSAQGGISR